MWCKELPNNTRKLLIVLEKCERVVARCPQSCPQRRRHGGAEGSPTPQLTSRQLIKSAKNVHLDDAEASVVGSKLYRGVEYPSLRQTVFEPR